MDSAELALTDQSMIEQAINTPWKQPFHISEKPAAERNGTGTLAEVEEAAGCRQWARP